VKISTNDYYGNIVNRISQYIYEYFDQPITLTSLSEKYGVSKYHLNRMFFAYTGMNLGEFIQRRRLEFAYSTLANQDVSVIDVALQVGYESPASFSRAFNRLFDIEPNRVRQKQAPEFALAKLIKQPQRHAIEGQILELPEKKLLGLYGQGFTEQSYFLTAKKLYTDISNTLGLTNGFNFAKQELIGISIDNPWRIDQTQSRFFAGVNLLEGNSVNNIDTTMLDEYIWTKGRWARFEHRGSYRTMWQTILNIYASWFTQHKYRIRDSALVQHYANDVMVTPEDELITYLYVPLEDD